MAKLLSLNIGPPGMISLIVTISLSIVNRAPIPSNVLAIPSLKACANDGLKYDVCGSTASVNEVMITWNASFEFIFFP
ncbi:hypothetical protein D3C78_1463510 [compost metagenome]